MAQAGSVELRKCRTSGCGCTVKAEDVYCSEPCENQARSAILAGHGCECGHAECRREKPPAV